MLYNLTLIIGYDCRKEKRHADDTLTCLFLNCFVCIYLYHLLIRSLAFLGASKFFGFLFPASSAISELNREAFDLALFLFLAMYSPPHTYYSLLVREIFKLIGYLSSGFIGYSELGYEVLLQSDFGPMDSRLNCTNRHLHNLSNLLILPPVIKFTNHHIPGVLF